MSEHDELVTFDFEDAQFKVDRPRRQLAGLVLPWNQVGRSDFALWKFQRGSVKWGDVGRVKLLRDHDLTQPVGRALSLEDREDGLYGVFSIARGEEGDKILSLAEDGVLDGFSAGPRISADGWEVDRNDRNVRLVHDAKLVEVTSTALPAMDDARVHSVRMQGGRSMAEEKKDQEATVLESEDSGMKKFQSELDERFAKLTDKVAESATAQHEQITNTIAAAFDGAFKRLTDAETGDRAQVARARFKVVSEPPVYRFDGGSENPSLIRDAWAHNMNGDPDAGDRLSRFREQQRDWIGLVVNTTNAADVIPPGYRPDLFVTQLMQGRPIVAQSSQGTISDATPFTVPRFVSATGATADHVEGTNPTGGTLTLDSVTVTPGGISGSFEITREIIDSSNPAIDAIALAAMRESWNQQTETKAYAALNGQAPAANQRTLTLAEQGTARNYVSAAREHLANYSFERFAAPTGAVISRKVTENFANAVDTTERPLLPSVGAQNTSGLGNAVTQGWFIDGLAFVPAWAVTEVAAAGGGDDVILILNRQDFWTWQSPLLTFRFEEKKGPALIELALFGYYATHLLRPAGLFTVDEDTA